MNLRENIKKELRLLSEQSSCPNCRAVHYAPACQSGNNNPPLGYYTSSGPCLPSGCPTSTNAYGTPVNWPWGNTYGSTSSGCMTINGQAPQIGDIFETNGDGFNNYGFNNIRIVTAHFDNDPNSCHCSWCTNPNPNSQPKDYPSATLSSCSPQGTYYGTSPSPCDTTPASACAQQWFPNPAPTWATSFMSSNDCTTYTWFANNLEQDAIDIMNDPTTPSPQPGPYNDWNDIKNAANASGLGQPEKGQFKRKMAKAKYSQCQIQACNC
jgi:hypothetical protein